MESAPPPSAAENLEKANAVVEEWKERDGGGARASVAAGDGCLYSVSGASWRCGVMSSALGRFLRQSTKCVTRRCRNNSMPIMCLVTDMAAARAKSVFLIIF